MSSKDRRLPVSDFPNLAPRRGISMKMNRFVVGLLALFLSVLASGCASAPPEPPPAPEVDESAPPPSAGGSHRDRDDDYWSRDRIRERERQQQEGGRPREEGPVSQSCFCTACGKPNAQGANFCGGCGKPLNAGGGHVSNPPSGGGVAAPNPTVTTPVAPPPAPREELTYYRLAANETQVVEMISSNSIWFDEIWGDLYLQEDWRTKLDSLGLRLQPAPAGFPCSEVMVVVGANCPVMKKWLDTRHTRAIGNAGGVTAQLQKVMKGMSDSAGAKYDKLVSKDGGEICHPQIMYSMNRAESLTFAAPASDAKTPDGKFTKATYQRSF